MLNELILQKELLEIKIAHLHFDEYNNVIKLINCQLLVDLLNRLRKLSSTQHIKFQTKPNLLPLYMSECD